MNEATKHTKMMISMLEYYSISIIGCGTQFHTLVPSIW